jgi:hypothetical protein
VPPTAAVAGIYARSWTNKDRPAVRKMIAPDVEIEWNLDLEVDEEELVQTLHSIAAFADSVEIVSVVVSGDRATLIYDCAAPFGTMRFAEFLTVTDGLITEVRQAYDTEAVRIYFPGLADEF